MWGWASVALACGGRDLRTLDAPLLPPEVHLEATLESFDGYEVLEAPVTRFLYALRPSDPEVYEALERAHEGSPADVPAPSLDAFTAALRLGDRAAARAAAAEVVEQLLDLPAPLAEPHADLLRPVVEYLEIEPHLERVSAAQVADAFTGGPVRGPLLTRSAEVRGLPPSEAAARLAAAPDHPRRASLRWLALREAIRARIPDGWSADDIAAATPAGVREELLAEADRWLADFPGHPLADHVRLAKLRVLYLTGDVGPAWPLLVDLYTRHPARAAEEMRFLLRQRGAPVGLDATTLPSELAVALAPWLGLDDATWSALWRHAEAAGSLPLQERLLLVVARSWEPLPEAFPAEGAPSPAWGRLRLQALVHRDLRDEAWAQSERLVGDPAVAPVRAWLKLARGDWSGALHEPGLDPSSVRYLLRVLAPDEVLRAHLDDPAIGPEARLVLALRGREQPRGWKRGARLLAPTDPERAALWLQARALDAAEGPDAPLAYARFLLDHAGALFGGRDYEEVVFYRSLPVTRPDVAPPRAPGLPFDAADEWEGTRRWLTTSFATWEALQAYAQWLALPADQRGATPVRAVVAEADRAYNALLNYASFDHLAWRAVVVDSEAAKTVRRAGREARDR